MTAILRSASYVRNEPPPIGAETVLRSIQQQGLSNAKVATNRIWELLETPQTIGTICHVLTRECQLDTDSCTLEVESFLDDLFREDLIQVSPDT